jgi:pimeloyl-ACP methyl ester carboxylesterase
LSASYYENSLDLGPGEQDILDALWHATSLHLIDPDRLYLAGFSMGGYGTWHIGLRNPDLFAAIAPGAGWTDGIEHWEKTEHMVSPPNLATALGGAPGTSPEVDARYLGASGRFLLTNAMNLPIHVFHGDEDTQIPNNLAYWPYMHSRHVSDTPGYIDERGPIVTLEELAAAFPGYYYFETTFTPGVGHNRPAAMHPETVFAFFDEHVRDRNPMVLAYRTYDDVHDRNHWLRLFIAAPNTTASGLARVSRNPRGNSFDVELEGESTVALDLVVMGINNSMYLSFGVAPLPEYAGRRRNAITLHADWSGWEAGGYYIRRDGEILVEGVDYTHTPDRLDILAFDLTEAHEFAVVPTANGIARPEVTTRVGQGLRCAGAFPNPAVGSVELRGSGASAGPLEVAVIDASGRIRRRINRTHPGGDFSVSWDGLGEEGHRVPVGFYWMQIRSGSERVATRIARIR